jgi:hypothetical protein
MVLVCPSASVSRQGQSAILENFEVSHHAELGLVNASPMKMEPAGFMLAIMSFKFLCQDFLSLIPINQMNTCT